jgi:hypothetical protein
MVQGKKTFIKSSYRVNKRILERCIGWECDLMTHFYTSAVEHQILR